jgi:hypothetical protein
MAGTTITAKLESISMKIIRALQQRMAHALTKNFKQQQYHKDKRNCRLQFLGLSGGGAAKARKTTSMWSRRIKNLGSEEKTCKWVP